MARRSGTSISGLTPDEIDALRAQTGLTNAQAQALADEAAYRRGQLGIEQGKLNLGSQELAGKNRQTNLETAAKLLGFKSALDVENMRSRSDAISDILKNPQIQPTTAAAALAGMGNPALFNAMAADKARQRDTAINQMIPALQAAKSDEERVKKIKPGLEALGPGTYNLALARAFPKPGVDTTIKPETFTGPVTTPETTPGFGELANRLLAGGETTPAPTSAPIRQYPYRVGVFGGNVPETMAERTARQQQSAADAAATEATLAANPRAFADTSVGALEGSRRTDLANNLTSLVTPSGGEIRFRTPRTPSAENTLARFIGPRVNTDVVGNVNPPPTETGYPAPITPEMSKVSNVFGNLIAPTPPISLPTPTPTIPPPAVTSASSTATPPAPQITPEMLAELRRRGLY